MLNITKRTPGSPKLQIRVIATAKKILRHTVNKNLSGFLSTKSLLDPIHLINFLFLFIYLVQGYEDQVDSGKIPPKILITPPANKVYKHGRL